MLSQAAQVEPLTAEECQRLEDMRWAQDDPEVIAKYCGQFVVPYNRKIVAHGHDVQAVLAEASRKTGLQIEELGIVGVDNPLLDVTSH